MSILWGTPVLGVVAGVLLYELALKGKLGRLG